MSTPKVWKYGTSARQDYHEILTDPSFLSSRSDDDTISDDHRTVTEEWLQSNKDLKHMKRTTARNEPYFDQTSSMESSEIIDEQYEDEYAKSEQYKIETYRQQLEICQETIVHLRTTIHMMEELEQLKITEHGLEQYANVPSDHRFIYGLFRLCLKHSSYSPNQDMKTYIHQTLNHLINRSSKIKSHRINYFTCKCLHRTNPDHKPSYQYCLNILEQCQTLFDIDCFAHISTSLTNLYYEHREWKHFIHSISTMLKVNNKNPNILLNALTNRMENTKSEDLNTFQKVTTTKDMNETMPTIHSSDNFTSYYHHFIEQLTNLLEVSKGDQIIPAIKTLKLLAHSDIQYQSSYTSRLSPINIPDRTQSEEK